MGFHDRIKKIHKKGDGWEFSEDVTQEELQEERRQCINEIAMENDKLSSIQTEHDANVADLQTIINQIDQLLH